MFIDIAWGKFRLTSNTQPCIYFRRNKVFEQGLCSSVQ